MNLTKSLTAAAISIAMAVPAARAATVNAIVAPASISVGDSFTIELETEATTPAFLGFQTILSWDGSALDLTAIAYNASLEITSPPAGNGPFSNPINVSAGSFLNTLSGAETLATFTFEALAEGVTVVAFGDPGFDGGFLTSADTGESLFDGPVSATVSIDPESTTVIPLPASLLLLLGGLFGLGVFGRTRA